MNTTETTGAAGRRHLNIEMSKFKGMRDRQPRPTSLPDVWPMLTVDEFVRAQTGLHRTMMESAARHRDAGETELALAKEKLAREAKETCPLFSPAVVFYGGKGEQHIAHYTGLSLCDFDHVPEGRMDDAFRLFVRDRHTLLCYRTISGRGLRVVFGYEADAAVQERLYNLSECDPRHLGWAEVYRAAFYQGNRYYAALSGLSFDAACSNPNRLCGTAHDPQAFLQREEAEFFTISEAVLTDAPNNHNLTTGRPHTGRPRTARSAALADAEPHLERYLQKVGAVYTFGRRHDYVTKALFQLNRWGVGEAEAAEWMDAAAADLPASERTATLRSVYGPHAAEHGTEPLPRQRRPAERSVGRPPKYAGVDDIVAWLKEAVEARKNEITGYIELRPSAAAGEAGGEEAVPSASACGPAEAGRPQDAPSASADDGSGAPTDAATPTLTTAARTVAATAAGSAAPRRIVYPWERADESASADAGPGDWRPLTDEDVNTLCVRMAREGRPARREDVRMVLESELTPKYNALTEYLRTLPPWDPETCPDHVAALAARVHLCDAAAATLPKAGATVPPAEGSLFADAEEGRLAAAPAPSDEESAFFVGCLRKWLVALVAGVYGERTVNHTILVLVGPQGSYKSTFLEYLLPPELRRYYLVKTDSQTVTKDDKFDVTENLLINWEELDTMPPRELNQLKAITTATHINERRAYGHFKEYRPHIASFCGTGNQQAFLTDTTGNRRWMPFLVRTIDPPQEHPIDYAGLYGQLLYLYATGFRYWFDATETRALEQHNLRFCVPQMEAERLVATYRRPLDEAERRVAEQLTATDILVQLNIGLRQPLSVRAVRAALQQLGFEKTATSSPQVPRYYVVKVKDKS